MKLNIRKKNRTQKKRSIGGDIKKHNIFESIKSIGFEIETTDLTKFTLVNDEGKNILVNSSLTNSDLEYGYIDPDEYTYIIEETNETFKITNDSAEDSDFNSLIKSIYYDDEDEDEDEDEVEDEDSNNDYKKGGKKTRKLRRCKYGERLENDKCPRKVRTCKYGERLQNNKCPRKVRTCKYGQPLSNGKCPRKIRSCKYGDRLSNGKCPRKVVTLDHEEDFMFLEIPKNKHLKQTKYDVKFRETSYELTNFSSFTDVEYISTYYKPKVSENVIVSYFFETINVLVEHLNKLVVIPNSKLYINKNNDITQVKDLIEQLYILPNTTLMYYNTSTYKISNFDINTDLKIVPQMTFSCDIIQCYKIMTELLKLNSVNLEKLNITCSDKSCENEQALIHALNEKSSGYNYDEYVIERSFKITNLLFKNNKLTKYKLNENDALVKMLKMYFFLIFYKLFIYLNSYISEIGTAENMLKKHLSFAIRHSNYVLFLEIKKQLSKILNKDEDIKEFLSILLNNEMLDKMIYDTPLIKNKRRTLLLSLKTNKDPSKNYFGNPIKSIDNYFDYLYMNNEDWLVANNIDEKSTKFDLSDNMIIIEFRDFPFYMYSYLYMNSNDSIKNDIIQNNIGTLNIKILKDYMKSMKSMKSIKSMKSN
jgi:hypothetical protein